MKPLFRKQRLWAFMRKENLQIWRDPSSILIAVILPLLLMFLFGFGISLDANKIRIGLVLEDQSPTARRLADTFINTPYFDVRVSGDRAILEQAMINSQLRGVIVIEQDFSQKLLRGVQAPIQILADGSETNTAIFVKNYAQGAIANWVAAEQEEHGDLRTTPIVLENRVWFNAELKSHNVFLPGSVAIIMALIGILLTALVVAREWERGTMEAMMATPIQKSEIILGKLIPYFLLGLGSMILCLLIATLLFDVPFRGSFFVLLLSTSIFLVAALSQGLLISTLTRNQMVAGQIAVITGFVPSFMLTGFIFELQSMPTWLQIVSYILPARYFIAILKTSFLTGTVWELLIPNLLCLSFIAGVFLLVVAHLMNKRVD